MTRALVDTRFGDFELLSRLGGGGFGEVWLAQKPGERPVALKILSGRQQSEEAARLRAEIELLAAAASSRSKHIVRVLGGGSEPAPHVVMEYIEGTDLSQEIARRGAIPVEEVVWIAAGIAQALAALQHAGIIHRDVKPANVMIDSEGTIKLTDFGIAKIVGLESITTTNHLTMSMAYAAPEVWDGQTSHLSDHYAFGALLFHCLTGRPLFIGTYAEMYRRHLEAAPDLDALPKEVPLALRTLIGDCLAKLPGQRPASASALLAALDLAHDQLADQAESTVIRSRPEPRLLGPWVIDRRDAQNNWLFHCHHETTPEKALVEVHFADNLEYGAALRQATLRQGASADRHHGSRVLGSSRLVLRPGEGWRGAPSSPFLFWVAREAPASTGSTFSSVATSGASESVTSTTSRASRNPLSEHGTILEDASLRSLRLAAAPYTEVHRAIEVPAAPAVARPIQNDDRPRGSAPNRASRRRTAGHGMLKGCAALAAVTVAIAGFFVLGDGSQPGQGGGTTSSKQLAGAAEDPAGAIASAAAYTTSGKAALDAKNYDQALADLTKAIELNPKDATAYRYRGFTHEDLKQNDLALADFNRGIGLAPLDGAQYWARGVFYKDTLNNAAAAWNDLNKAIELNPKDVSAYFHRGMINASANNDAAAFADYSRAIELGTKSSATYNNRGIIYGKRGQHDLSAADYSKAIELDPNRALYYQNRANAYFDLKRNEEAKADYTKSLELDSSGENGLYSYYYRGIVFARQGNDNFAIGDLSKAIELNPSYVKAYEERANAYVRQERPLESIADFSVVIRSEPNRADLYGNRGLQYSLANRYEEARADFTRQIELGDGAKGYHWRGLVFSVEGKHALAIADYTKAIELNPNNAKAYKNRGQSYQLLGKVDLAKADLAKSQALQ